MNPARGDYRLGNVLGGKIQSRRILIHWHGTFLCLLAVGFLAQLSVIYSRAWIVLFYASGLVVLVPLRRLLTRATLSASRNGIVSAKRIFIVGAESRISAFLDRYRPSQLGVEVAGRYFLPLLPDSALTPLMRFHWTRSSTADSTTVVQDSLAVPMRSETEESGTLEWDPRLGPVRWERLLKVRARIPPGRPFSRGVATEVIQRVNVARRSERCDS